MRTALVLVLLSLVGFPAPADAQDAQVKLDDLLKNRNQVDHLIGQLPNWSEVAAQRWQPTPGKDPWQKRAQLPVPDKTAKLTVLHVWATWCEPCMPELAELGRIYGVDQSALATAKLVVVLESGNTDKPDKPDQLLSKVQEAIKAWPALGGKVPLFLDATDGITRLVGAQTAFGPPSYPTTLLLDSCGVVRHAFVGSIVDRVGVFELAVQRLLNAPSACPPASPKKPGK
jgi:thiol-disulfide isomerase/thioredoxin